MDAGPATQLEVRPQTTTDSARELRPQPLAEPPPTGAACSNGLDAIKEEETDKWQRTTELVLTCQEAIKHADRIVAQRKAELEEAERWAKRARKARCEAQDRLQAFMLAQRLATLDAGAAPDQGLAMAISDSPSEDDSDNDTAVGVKTEPAAPG